METVYWPENLSSGTIISIDDENEFRHAIKSLRKQIGDRLLITNGRGELFNAEIAAIGKRDFSLSILERIDNDTDYTDTQVTIALALLNQSSKMKLVMEKLTEIGITALLPFQAARTVFPDKNLKGLEASAVSALKQCGGAMLPRILPIATFKELLQADGYDYKLFCHFTEEKFTDSRLAGSVLVAVGPEGGWTDEEVFQLEQHGFVRISLNRRVLRAETAALVAAAKFLN